MNVDQDEDDRRARDRRRRARLRPGRPALVLRLLDGHDRSPRRSSSASAAASLVFLSAYGGMVSLAQAGLFGIAGFILGNMVTEGRRRAGVEGPHARLGPDARGRARDRADAGIGLDLRRGRLPEPGIYFLMITLTYSVIAYLFFGQVTKISGFSAIGGITSYTPGSSVTSSTTRTGSTTSPSASRSSSTCSSATSCARRSGSRSRASATSRSAWPRSGTTSRCTGRSRSASARFMAALGRRPLRLVVGPGLSRRRRPAGDDQAARDRRDRRARRGSRARGSARSPSS